MMKATLKIFGYGDNNNGQTPEPEPLVHFLLNVEGKTTQNPISLTFPPKYAAAVCDAITKMAFGAAHSPEFEDSVTIEMEGDW